MVSRALSSTDPSSSNSTTHFRIAHLEKAKSLPNGEADLSVPHDLNAQLQRQLLLSELVNQVNHQIRSTPDLDGILTFTSTLLGQRLSCEQVRILVLEPDSRDTLLVRSVYHRDQSTQGLICSTFSIEKSAYLRALMTHSGALSLRRIPITLEQNQSLGELELPSVLDSILAIATYYQGQVNGVIELHRGAHQPDWQAWEQQILEEVGNQIAVVINQARLQVEMQRQVEREALLRLVINQIRSSLDFDIILQTIVKEVRQLLNTDRVVIYQFIAGWQGKVVVEDVIAPWDSVLGEIGQDNCFSAQYAELYQGGRVRAIHNIFHAGLDDCHVRFLQRMQVQANLIVPILQTHTDPNLDATQNSELWGLLIAHECRAPRRWQPWETALLRQLADQVAIALHQAELYVQVRQAAITSQTQASDLQAALSELRATQAQLIQTEKLSSLGQMVAGVAHEINNATNFIHANLPYVQEYARLTEQVIDFYRKQCPEQEEAIAQVDTNLDLDFVRSDFPKLIHSMQNGTERIREIVQTLRNFSRLDEAEHKAVDLHEGIESSLVILKHRMEAGLTLRKEYGVLPLVECHAGQINQVLLNLLSNALDAMEGKGELVIRTWQTDADTVSIAIRDNGQGIPADVQARMFDPFFTTKPIGKGTGLGLSICHQIVVQGHGGQIRCLSEPGQGAEFQIELPIHQSP